MTITVDHQETKRHMIAACLLKQQLLISDFKKRILALLESDSQMTDSGYDNADIAAASTRATEINLLNEQLRFAEEELELLERMRNDPEPGRDRVMPGAVVRTNHGTFFISVSIEKFSSDGNDYIGISTKSPLYKAMKGKAARDSFRFNGLRYQIQEIY